VLCALCAALLMAGGADAANGAPPASGQYRLHVPNAGNGDEAANPSTVPDGDDSGSSHLPLILGAVAVVAAVVSVALYSRRNRESGTPA
jgi:hypothetical protein